MKKTSPIYQLKITLNDSKPPIWRRILVSGDTRLDKFHAILQIVMGWTDSHLHQFSQGNIFYGEANDEDEFYGMEKEDERKFRLSQLLVQEKDSLKYEYDFGDGWNHKIVLEKKLPHGSVIVPSCIKGKRACPPEDCGGIWGYMELVEVMRDPSHDEYEERLEWLGGAFDPESLDIAEINTNLARYA
ncbi:conserved hypothetical protein [Gammaproteobacteria bacterium]